MRGRRAVALLAAGALALGACATSGSGSGSGSGPSAAPSTTTTTPPTTSAPATTTRPPADPAVDDVPDAAYPGLGDPRIDVASYDVTVVPDLRTGSIRGTATLRLAATTAEPLRSFTLDLRGPAISRATVAGRRAAVSATAAEVTIVPARPLRRGVTTEVVLRYTGTPEAITFPGLGVRVGWQPDRAGGWFAMSEPNGTSTWVPCSDHPSDKATWRIAIEVPEGVAGIANGQLRAGDPQPVAGGLERWRWTEVEPMASYLATVVVGRYDLVRRDVAGARGVFAFPSSLAADDRRGFALSDEILTEFSRHFGPYPDDDAGAIVVPTDLGVALEVQSRPMFGLDGLGGVAVPALAHELAHQWFGDAVTPATWRDVWLNEGFATYADWLWQFDDRTTLDQQAATTARLTAEVHQAVRSPEAARTFAKVVYDRGALTLHALRQTVGDATFFRILRTWVRTYGGATATTDDLVALSSKLAGQDLSGLFTAWLDRPDQPSLPG